MTVEVILIKVKYLCIHKNSFHINFHQNRSINYNFKIILLYNIFFSSFPSYFLIFFLTLSLSFSLSLCFLLSLCIFLFLSLSLSLSLSIYLLCFFLFSLSLSSLFSFCVSTSLCLTTSLCLSTSLF